MKSTAFRWTTVCLLAGLALLDARSHRRSSVGAGEFDYYVLSLSWAPDFCAHAGGNGNTSECGTGRHVGFVVHGLWPQANGGRGPENCASASPVSQSLITLMLNYFPTASLIQHEWKTHGTCSGLSANDYFSAVRSARDAVKIPTELTSLTQSTEASAATIEGEFRKANPAFPSGAFRATCTSGMLQEARICFNKNLQAQACTASAGECSSPSMTILPPR